MKEDPEHLNENLNRMLTKLQLVKKEKEAELSKKQAEFK
jgi:hypothetical protein